MGLLPRAHALLVAVAVAAGCQYTATTRLDYEPAAPLVSEPVPATLVVRELDDRRPRQLTSYLLGEVFFTYIPLLPYVSAPYERIDQTRRQFVAGARNEPDFPLAFADTIARDLRESGVFREVVRDGESAGPLRDYYVLEGELLSSEFRVTFSSYMLGMAGVLLWLLPLPMGKNTAVVEADLRLQDPSGRIVWSGKLNGRGSKIFMIYNSAGAAPTGDRNALEVTRYGGNDMGIDDNSMWAYYSEALRAGMAQVKASLCQSLGLPIR